MDCAKIWTHSVIHRSRRNKFYLKLIYSCNLENSQIYNYSSNYLSIRSRNEGKKNESPGLSNSSVLLSFTHLLLLMVSASYRNNLSNQCRCVLQIQILFDGVKLLYEGCSSIIKIFCLNFLFT